MATREYPLPDGSLTVHWDSDVCIHSRVCASTLPTVFRPGERPWVDVEGADADAVAATIDRCPSRALGWSRPDGSTSAGRAPTDGVRITATANGPLEVVGEVTVVGSDGRALRETRRAYLCRCGHSASKPFCDGSHSRVGFTDDGLGQRGDG
jgi:CDGSH-type Zn-finger protein/uncharacterized Fe-S cluster protein YjdI